MSSVDALSWEYTAQENGLYTVNTPFDKIIHVRPSVVAARQHFHDRADLVIAEIGVMKGDHARYLYRMMIPKTMYLIDCWEPIDRREKGEDYRDCGAHYKCTVDRFGDKENVVIIKGRSWDVMPTLEENSFDFIYIDGDHYIEACTKDILNGLRLVKLGGILGGHDYGSKSGLPIDNGGIAVPGAVFALFESMFVNGEAGDWWVTVDEEKKSLYTTKKEML